MRVCRESLTVTGFKSGNAATGANHFNKKSSFEGQRAVPTSGRCAVAKQGEEVKL